MSRWVIGIGVALMLFVGLAAGAYYWFFVQNGTVTGGYAIDMARVRALADSTTGEKPLDIRVEDTAPFSFRRAIVVAGDGWGELPLGVFSYRIDTFRGAIVLDTGVSPRGAQELGATIDMDAYRRVISALKYALIILVTHEHPDHIGGLLSSPYLEGELANARLNPQQLANLDRYNSGYRKAAFANYKPVDYTDYMAVAPGVVLIRAPGHTPGSQMVYVQLQNGAEYLFTGDVAWTMRNIDTVRERPRATARYLEEDRHAVMNELAALNALKKDDPKLHIVPGHDLAVVTELERKGLLLAHFNPAKTNYVF